MQVAPALLTVYALVLVIFSSDWGIIESSEARYAEIARTMFVSGDWLHPRLLNIQHFHKPPFTYWITALGYSIFGINELGARFFLVASLVVQVMVVHRIAMLLLKDKEVAFASAVLYASMPLVLTSVRGLTTDCYLQTFILLTLYFFIEWRITQKKYWLYLIAVAAALGFLTKGPLILILPILFFFGFKKSLPETRASYHHLISFLLFLVIGFSWYVYLAAEDEKFIRYFLFHQTFDRVTNAGVFSRNEPFWYYVLYTPLVALPWIILWVVGFAKNSWRNLQPTLQKITLYCVLAPLIFFSLVSSKLILYVLPIFPGVSIVAAYFLLQFKGPVIRNSIFFFFILVPLSFYSLPLFDPNIVTPTELMILPALAAILFFMVWKRKYVMETDRLLLGAFIFSVFMAVYSARFMKYNELAVNSTKPVAEWIMNNNLQQRHVIVYNRMLPSLAFHLNQNIISLHDGSRYLKRETAFEKNDEWKNYLFDLTIPSEADRLVPVLKQNPVLIVKGKIRSHSLWMNEYVAHHHEIGEWIIYY